MSKFKVGDYIQHVEDGDKVIIKRIDKHAYYFEVIEDPNEDWPIFNNDELDYTTHDFIDNNYILINGYDTPLWKAMHGVNNE